MEQSSRTTNGKGRASLSKLSFMMSLLAVIGISGAAAQNPLVNDQFTADPSARVFEGKVYVYPSHDLNCGTGWFCMKDYHVFSSENLVEWTDHGVIVSQEEVAWVDTTANAMWAPDAIERNGTYYFYFPAIGDSTTGFEGRRIGVAISETPFGPFTAQPAPIRDVHGIDPNLFIDDDGQAYLYWSAGDIFVAKLKENMYELASKPRVIENLPEKGLKEGPYMVKREGTYYLTYPHVEHDTERLEYAMGTSPMGPFQVTGVIMEEYEDCWTNHHSIIKYEDQWYLFYHHNDYSPDFDKNRSIRADSLFFNPDGSIQQVVPTLRGVGLTDAGSTIQIEQYSEISESGTSIAFLDTSNTFKGWKTIFTDRNGWIQYNAVDFKKSGGNSVTFKTMSEANGTLQIHLDHPDGPVIAEAEIPGTGSWEIVDAPVSGIESGVHNLVVTSAGETRIALDWLRFD